MKSRGLGVFLVLISALILVWNEGREVKRTKALSESHSEVVHFNEGDDLSNYQNKLIHVSDAMYVNDSIVDPDVGFHLKGLVMKRSVEMYQWDQVKSGDSSSSNYHAIWSDNLINSKEFKNRKFVNPSKFLLENEIFPVRSAIISGLVLSDEYLADLDNFEEVTIKNQSLYSKASIQDEFIFWGIGSIRNPEIGDCRLTYEYISEGDYSVIGKLDGNEIVSYDAKNGESVFLIEEGIQEASAMIEEAESKNQFLSWVFRLLGLFLLFLGVLRLDVPYEKLIRFVPVKVEAIKVSQLTAVSVLTLVIGGLLIAITWLSYRPIISIVVIVGLIATIVFTYQKTKNYRG